MTEHTHTRASILYEHNLEANMLIDFFQTGKHVAPSSVRFGLLGVLIDVTLLVRGLYRGGEEPYRQGQ